MPDTASNSVEVLRSFNRLYTARMGLLRRRHLDGEFSLTESRLLYEIGACPGIRAAHLCELLSLDAGYLSRSLSLLTRRKLVKQTASKQDAREKLLTLTASGQGKLTVLDQQSSAQIEGFLATLPVRERRTLVEGLTAARMVLETDGADRVRVDRLSASTDDALRLLDEYYEAVQVVVRDSPKKIRKIIDDPASGLWIATLNERAVGCVVLRPLQSIGRAGECKRLYVQPSARGHGIATALLDAQEEYARQIGLRWLYLDSYDDLKAAIELYRRRGYEPCKRYNDNPQATVFFRKKL